MTLQLVCMLLKKLYKVLKFSKRLYGKQRLLVLVAIIPIATLCVVATTYVYNTSRPKLGFNETRRLVEKSLEQYYLEEKGKGCEIPKVDPFAADAMMFVEDFPKITCPGIDWVTCNKSVCYVNEKILNNITDITCKYRDIVYVDDHLYYLTDEIKVNENETYSFNRSDHIKVSCTGKDRNSYGILYSRWTGIKVGFRPMEPMPIPPNRKDSLNVLILAFDSASHNGFIRKMPKSYKHISDRAVILNGYNVVGDGTAANVFPLLSGKAECEHPDARIGMPNKEYVDHKLFLFHKLKKYGYQTAYFEDSPSTGTFVYKYNGCRRQPADHYLRAFLLENYIVNDNGFCVGDTPLYQLLLNLTLEFLKFDSKKFDFTFIADICHDHFNQISTADEDVVSFLETLAARRVFEDTLVLVMGDHGIRCDEKVRSTYHGRLEERLPLMAIFLPEKLKQARPNALEVLKQNIDVLTTPFDIHATLLDVLDLKELNNNYKVPGCDIPRGRSLLEPIPKTRTCPEAGIVQHWCTCFKWFEVSQLDPMYIKTANALAEYIDNISEEQRSKCARRHLISVESILRHNVNNELLSNGKIKEKRAFLGKLAPRALREYYQAKIILSPGRGIFEATMMYNTQTNFFTIFERDISRISLYGNEPKCVKGTHPHLYPFCYCKDHVPEHQLNETTTRV